MNQKCLRVLLLVLLLLGIQGNGAWAQQPVVYATLFFSPSCGHCHYIINEFLPPLQEQYGEQLWILYIDVSEQEGGTLFYAACESLEFPEDRCGYVPTLIIGTTVLIGSRDIPDQMPALVQAGLEGNGIDIPAVPGLREAYQEMRGNQQATQEQSSEEATPDALLQEITWQDRLNQDPLGNGLAIGILGILAIGLAIQLGYGARLLIGGVWPWGIEYIGWLFLLGSAVITTIVAGTLVLDHNGLSLPTVLAISVLTGMVLIVWTLGRTDRRAEHMEYSFPTWLLPVVACLGLAVAGYLAYVELGENNAVCGAVGDCNTVQQSDYADLFGLIPIGVLGVFGYVMILAGWLVGRYATGWIGDAAQAALLGLALFGTAFSIYLTFLEPFVIGATCAWCLTSAMFMILILCLQAPAGWSAVSRLLEKLRQ